MSNNTRITNAQIAQMMQSINNTLIATNRRLDELEARMNTQTSAQTSPKSKAPKKQTAPKDTPFTKKDGTVVMMTAKEAAAKAAWRDRERMSLDEIKACSFDGKWTAEMDSWLAKNPVCTCKEFKTNFPAARGCTKEQLKEHKTALRSAGKMK